MFCLPPPPLFLNSFPFSLLPPSLCTALKYVIMCCCALSTHPLVVVPGAQLTDRQSVVSEVPVFADRWQHHVVTKRGKISVYNKTKREDFIKSR